MGNGRKSSDAYSEFELEEQISDQNKYITNLCYRLKKAQDEIANLEKKNKSLQDSNFILTNHNEKLNDEYHKLKQIERDYQNSILFGYYK